jgi:hypothetical protein
MGPIRCTVPGTDAGPSIVTRRASAQQWVLLGFVQESGGACGTFNTIAAICLYLLYVSRKARSSRAIFSCRDIKPPRKALAARS